MERQRDAVQGVRSTLSKCRVLPGEGKIKGLVVVGIEKWEKCGPERKITDFGFHLKSFTEKVGKCFLWLSD